MNFDEWHEMNTHSSYNSLDCPHYAWEKVAWDAAIEEAIKVAKEGHDYTPTSTAHNIAKRIKELKE